MGSGAGGRYLIFAWASLRRIMDSSCRVVAVMRFSLARTSSPNFLISTYCLTSSSPASSVMEGLMTSLAYEIYEVNSSIGYCQRVKIREYNDILGGSVLRTVFKVHPDEMSCQSTICNFIDFVEDKVDEIESGKQRRREIDVLWDWKIWIVFTSDWICRGEDTGSCVEGGNDSCLCDGHSLLFHDFM